MNKALIHIFDKSACLTHRQMREYVNDNMTNEECHAVEMHLNSCPLCSDAIDGVQAQKRSGSIQAIETLDMEFLKERFAVSHPEVHLNSLAPAQTVTYVAPKRRRGKLKARPFRHTSAVALLLVFVIGILWYKENKTGIHHAVTNAGETQEQEAVVVSEAGTNDIKEETTPASFASDKENNKSQPASDNGQRPQTLIITADNKPVATKEPETGKLEVTPAKAAYSEYSPKPAVVKTSITAPVVNTTVKKTESISDGSNKTAESIASSKATNKPEKAEVAKNRKSEERAAPGIAFIPEAGNDKERRQATLVTAKSYLNSGKKSEAVKLLEQLAGERGREKREAKRMLRDMKKEAGEQELE